MSENVFTPYGFSGPVRTLFGRGSRAEAARLIAEMGSRVLVVRGRAVCWAETLARELREAGVSVEVLYSTGEPTLEGLRAALEEARAAGPDCVVAIGGGAVVDFGKALAGLIPGEGDPADYLEIGAGDPRPFPDPLPFVAVPTTSGTGAEATKNAVIGVPEQQMKISLRDPRLMPTLALVDPALTDGTPKAVTLACGLDALTQLIESYLTRKANPVTDALCRGTIPDTVAALAQVMTAENAGARDAMARASHLSGLALANSGLGVVHGLAAVLGTEGGAHGAICGRLLPAALEVNAEAAQAAGQPTERFAEVREWLATGLGGAADDALTTLRAFIDRHGLPSLSELGCPVEAEQAVAERALGASSTKGNPVTLDVERIGEILSRSR